MPWLSPWNNGRPQVVVADGAGWGGEGGARVGRQQPGAGSGVTGHAGASPTALCRAAERGPSLLG